MKKLLLLVAVVWLILPATLFAQSGNEAKGTDTINTSYTYRYNESDDSDILPDDRTPPVLMIGAGVLTFYGDYSKKNRTNNPVTGRMAFEVTFIQPLNSYLDLRVFAWGGKISANERSMDRNLNFQSTLIAGGFSITYNFDQLLKPERRLEPFIGVGFEMFEFNSKTDLYDKNGTQYYYWSDGSIRNAPEGSVPIDATVRLERDYVYETDIRKSNFDGFGDYNTFGFAIPVTAGVTINLAERWNFQLAATYHFTFTDYIDGVTADSKGNRKGDGAYDNLLYIGAGLSYDLTRKPRDRAKELADAAMLSDLGDSDNDGVPDLLDDCMKTPEGVEVDERGCPLDKDADRVGDYKDDEPESAPNAQTDSLGVTYTEVRIDSMYGMYLDSTGKYSPIEKETHTVQVVGGKVIRYKTAPRVQYAVSIGEFEDAIPAELVNSILSVPDIETTEDNGKVVLTVGKYNTIEEAKARQAELRKAGITGTDVVSLTRKGAGIKSVKTITGEKTAFDVNEWKMAESKDIIYRVQVGAFLKSANEIVFKYLPNVIKISSDDGYTRYFTGTFPNYNAAAKAKIDIIQMGFEDAFVVALQGGKKIPLSVAGATLLEEHKQKLESAVPLSPAQKENLRFRVQLGSFKKQVPTNILQKYMELEQIDQIKGSDGYTRYVAGSFATLSEANAFKRELLKKGFEGVFVVGEFNGELIPASKAIEMLKR